MSCEYSGKTLPYRKLHELVSAAIADLKKVDEDKRYIVNMGTYHESHNLSGAGVCMVCFAGGVMAKELDAKLGDYVGPSDFDPGVRLMLYALNSIRCGHVDDAISYFYVGLAAQDEGVKNGDRFRDFTPSESYPVINHYSKLGVIPEHQFAFRPVHRHSMSKEIFYSDMERIAEELKAADL